MISRIQRDPSVISRSSYKLPMFEIISSRWLIIDVIAKSSCAKCWRAKCIMPVESISRERKLELTRENVTWKLPNSLQPITTWTFIELISAACQSLFLTDYRAPIRNNEKFAPFNFARLNLSFIPCDLPKVLRRNRICIYTYIHRVLLQSN